MENHGDQGVSGEGMPEFSCEVDGVPLSVMPRVTLGVTANKMHYLIVSGSLGAGSLTKGLDIALYAVDGVFVGKRYQLLPRDDALGREGVALVSYTEIRVDGSNIEVLPHTSFEGHFNVNFAQRSAEGDVVMSGDFKCTARSDNGRQVLLSKGRLNVSFPISVSFLP